MATALEYALMAGSAYISNHPEVNLIPIPSGWVKKTNPDSYFKNPDSGFEAISYTNGSELVISFAGTYPKNPDGSVAPLPQDLQADANLATGYRSD